MIRQRSIGTLTETSYASLPCPGYEGGDEEAEENQEQVPLEATFSGQQSAFKDARDEAALQNNNCFEPASSQKNLEANNDKELLLEGSVQESKASKENLETNQDKLTTEKLNEDQIFGNQNQQQEGTLQRIDSNKKPPNILENIDQ